MPAEPARAPETLADLIKDIEAAEPGVHVVRMNTLRRLSGKRRSDAAAIKDLMTALRERHVRFLPEPLPTRADQAVVLYRLGSEIGEFCEALMAASNETKLDSIQVNTLRNHGQQAERAHAVELERLQGAALTIAEHAAQIGELAAKIRDGESHR